MQTYIKPSELKSKLKTLISIQKPAFIWGASGIGKSEIIAKVADELGYNLIDVRVSLLDPVDLRGVPTVNQFCFLMNYHMVVQAYRMLCSN